MSIWEWPKAHRADVQSNFYLQPGNLTAVSQFTGQTTPYGPQFQRWCCKVQLPTKKGVDWRELQGLITRLRGQSELIRMVDYHRMRPGYDEAFKKTKPAGAPWSDDTYWSDGSGWVEGYLPPHVYAAESATRDQTTLKLQFPTEFANVVKPLRMGDLFEVRPAGISASYPSLHEVTRDCRLNADAQTRIEFEPGLRAGVNNGDMIVIRYPKGLFRLASDSEGIIQRSLGNLGDVGLSFVEALDQL